MKFVMAVAAVVASTALIAPTAASAQEREIRSVSVSYADLDLADAAAQEKLQRRVDRAARRMCASNGDRGLSGRNDQGQCLAEARSSADREVAIAIRSHQTRLAQRSE